MDVRQGPLLIRNDPLATAAEIASITRPGRDHLRRFLAMPTDQRPTLTAFAGYVDPFGRRYFYKALDGWRGTIDEEMWHAH